LVFAAEKTHYLGLDFENKGKDSRPLKLAKARNLYWMDTANDEGRPALENLRLTTDFGCGQRQVLSRHREKGTKFEFEPLEKDMVDYDEDDLQLMSAPHHDNLAAKSTSTTQGEAKPMKIKRPIPS
jgi:hypothetical protein